jgi:hypothetical protein
VRNKEQRKQDEEQMQDQTTGNKTQCKKKIKEKKLTRLKSFLNFISLSICGFPCGNTALNLNRTTSNPEPNSNLPIFFLDLENWIQVFMQNPSGSLFFLNSD